MAQKATKSKDILSHSDKCVMFNVDAVHANLAYKVKEFSCIFKTSAVFF